MTKNASADSAQPEFDPIRVDTVPEPEYIGEQLDIPGKIILTVDDSQYITSLNYVQTEDGEINMTVKTSNKPKTKRPTARN